jgi:hypothetical protein
LRFWWVAVVAVAALVGPAVPAVAVDEAPAPVVVVNPAGPWVTSGWVEASWSVESSVEIAGWAVTVDDQADTDPGEVVTQTDPVWASWLDDGVHWLHVRAIGVDASSGAVTHTRLAVDTVAPQVTGLASSSHPSGEVSTDASVDLVWDVPEDVSGVVGYQVVVSDGDAPVEEAGVVTTSQAQATVEVPSDGVWSLSVRAVDAAGLWGPFAVYQVMVDASAPGPVTVSGTHESGVATSQRHLVMSFAASPSDGVVAWVATVDGSPTATLDAGAARPEPRLVATLEPGRWWVHVAGVDSLGRLGAVTDFPVVVSTAEYAVDVATGRHLWGPTHLDVLCPATTTATVQAIAPDGARTDVGPLEVSAGSCGVQWDPTVEADGSRLWPDGEYQLVVVEGGVDVSEPVGVSVGAGAGPVDRINADYAAGLITATEQADVLIQAMGDPAGLPATYVVEGVSQVPQATTLLAALTAEGQVPEALVADVTPTLVSATGRAARAGTAGTVALTASSFTTGCANTWKYLRIGYDCVANSDHFTVLYQSLTVGSTSPGSPLPDTVALALTSLERARTVYMDQGFAAPNWTLVLLDPFLGHNAGLSLPALTNEPIPTITMSPVDLVPYLPHHEFFHQVQYQYLQPAPVAAMRMANGTDIYWWMEATAEWGAHLVQTQDTSFTPTSDYASNLRAFLDNSAQSLDTGTPLTAGGPEYGAFPMAEFLQQNYGVGAIESTWQKIGRLFLPRWAASAIASVMADHGDSYSEQIHRFRQWMYPLGAVDGWGGFTTSDAQPGGVWRQKLGGDSVRVPSTSVELNASDRQASDTLFLGPSGAAYVEFTGPRDLVGKLTVSVTGGASATILDQVGDFPTLCSRGGVSRSTNAAPQTVADTAVLGSTYEGGCPNAVLVITNTTLPLPQIGTAPQTGVQEITWTAKFVPDGVTLDNQYLTLGVHNTGALGYLDGINRHDSYYVGFSDGWGISDSSTAGSSFSSYQDTTDTNVEPGSFTFNTARTTAYTGTSVSPPGLVVSDLVVSQRIHPSTDPNLYAIDVTVTRRDPWGFEVPPSTSHVHYRRSAQWDVTWSQYADQMMSVWAKAPNGDDARVTTMTDRTTKYGPPAMPQASTYGYATSGPSWTAGDTLDLDLGVILADESVSFTLYYGVALTKAAAETAVAAVEADVSYLVYPSWQVPAQSATGIFAYKATTPTT